MEPVDEPLLAPSALAWGLLLPVRVELPDPDVAILRAVGELDLLTVPALHDHLHAQLRQRRHVIVDLDRVTFLGATAIRVLVQAKGQARADGVGLHVTGTGQQHLARPLRVTGQDQVLSFSPHTADELAARLVANRRA